ncbi:MAG: hypothetical protein J6B85_03985 [Lachnospiraceae bacterium]|nr:hypothetical protein [Lachnospiraceae bacterium]
MDYRVDRGRVIADAGVPYLPRWFCDDLVAMEVDKYGISKVEYFNRTTRGSEKVFIDDMWGGIRFYLYNQGYRSGQTLKNCEVMPYGFSGEWHYKGMVFRYEQRIINNSIWVSLRPTGKICPGLAFTLEFYDHLCFTPQKSGDNRYVSGIERTWREWQYDGTCLKSSYRELDAYTHVAIGSNTAMQYGKHTIGNSKIILISEELEEGKEYRFVIALDETEAAVQARIRDTLLNDQSYIEKQERRYEEVIERSPVLESPYDSLNRFFALAPLYHESCKVTSVPGAVRAKTEHYWIWGWDGMSSGFAYSYWGDEDYIGKLLQLYLDTADPEAGIGHWFARDMSHIQTSMVSAQGFYISLLYLHWMNGGDIRPYYEFAKKIFGMIRDTEVGDLGLCEGYSLFPDFRNAILETGHDISTFNNSSTYCAVCAMRTLAKEMQDSETQNKAAALADRMRQNFGTILYDESKGFFAGSADAKTLKRREVYLSPGIKWDNLFCRDLIEKNRKELLRFFEKNFVCEAGLLFVPVWGKGYDADANQLHCYWPAISECYARLMNLENRKDLIERFISWIGCWTDVLMCPEGIDCYDNVNEPKPDGWNAINGAWQAYSMRAWYEATVHSVVGVDFAENGMNLYPYDGEELVLKNLHFRHKTFTVRMKGSGCRIQEVILNGKSLGAVSAIPMEAFAKENWIEVIRTCAE